jgi:hypothetical protein
MFWKKGGRAMYILESDTSRKYRATSWVDPRVECRPSPISGQGLFAGQPIAQREVIVIWGGRLFLAAEVKAGLVRERSVALIGEGLYLGSAPGSEESLDELMNHSCDPNVWLQDEVTLIALRDIALGEELTLDYALFETDLGWRMECNCGSANCRRVLTGSDWKLEYLQVRYQHHFSPYINRRIAASATRARRINGVLKP